MQNTRQSSELQRLTGVGPKVEKVLNRLGLYSCRDLLFHLPARYEDRTTVFQIADLQPGIPQLIQGEITAQSVIPGRRMQAVLAFEDLTGVARIRLFHFSRAYLATLKSAASVRIFGEPRINQGITEFIHPEISVFKGDPPPLDETLTPIYPTTDGLSQPKLRDLIRQALAKGADFYALDELLEPAHTKHRPALWDALLALHQPTKGLPASPYVERLAFEELLAHRLLLLTRRDKYISYQAPCLKSTALQARKQLIAELPFELTEAQQRVLKEIDQDLQSGHSMLRLLQGDVGSGKTLVAALAALPVIDAGFQVALMAPTELLSEQHAAQFTAWFSALGISVGWLTGSMKVQPRRTILEQIANGSCQIVIGTHALFQTDIVFHQLGLIIIDEQHRFGVAQRLLLREKGKDLTPHQLIMTATPIPRTLAMTRFADLDVSVIDALPPGRTPVDTRLLSQTRATEITSRLDAQFNKGGQAYWVCTLIEESNQSIAEAAETRAEKLKRQLPHRRVGLVHGRMKADDKSQIMAAFIHGDLDLLVATTVIEVGVNVPNANVIVIENPERLGLAQLHQLRGRVGRGMRVSFCLLLAGDSISQQSRDRLNLLKETNDGFILAEADLQLRGPGDVIGTRQTGELSFRVADLTKHAGLLDEIASLAETIRTGPLGIREQLIERWVGHEEHFAHV
jgi:ATP-dependent DNA helicase RecG